MTETAVAAVNGKLTKIRWQQDLARRGQVRKEDVSPELAEALRNEIRTALDAGGKPFDVNIARRVYDLAIAARDMCVAASSSVKEAVDQIKDTNGPMETLQDPDAPEPPLQAAETYGARIIKELMAIVPKFLSGGASGLGGDDPKALVHALAEARSRGMHDVAEEIEKKLFGRVLTGPRPVTVGVGVEVPEGSYAHGFADGQVNAPVASSTTAYNVGYREGTTKRLLGHEVTKGCACPAFDNSRDGMHHDQACPRFARAALDEKEIARLHPDTRERYARNAMSVLAGVRP